VLVVDDNEDVLTLFERYLSSGGYQPVLAQTGAEAIAIATAEELYAITLDLMMTGEDGWDVLQALRGHPRASDIPVVVCSVLDHEHLALALGAQAFLKKPIMREPLLQVLHDLQPSPESAASSRQ
jgi:CheY-like chemotaxis protein